MNEYISIIIVIIILVLQYNIYMEIAIIIIKPADCSEIMFSFSENNIIKL